MEEGGVRWAQASVWRAFFLRKHNCKINPGADKTFEWVLFVCVYVYKWSNCFKLLLHSSAVSDGDCWMALRNLFGSFHAFYRSSKLVVCAHKEIYIWMTELWPRHISRSLILPFGIRLHLTFVWIAIVYRSFAIPLPPTHPDRYTQWPFSFQHEVDMANGTHKIFRFSLCCFFVAAYEKYTSTVSVFYLRSHFKWE